MGKVPPLPDDVVELGQALIPRPVFLVGCARSGTSILGEAIAAHPAVDYLFEASRIWNEIVPARPDHRLVASDAGPEMAREIYRALVEARDALGSDSTGTSPLPQAPADAAPPTLDPGGTSKGGRRPASERVLLEKNPKHVIRIPFLSALFPHAGFIHIVRDGRDTVASLMFRNRGERWGHLEIPGWRELLARYPRDNHIRCAHQWREAVRTARDDAATLEAGHYMEVRYEDLLERPQETMDAILGFLRLAPHPAVEAFLSKIQDATEGSYHAKRQVRHYVENHSRRVGRYLENLSSAQIAEIEAVCGDLLRELGYTPSRCDP